MADFLPAAKSVRVRSEDHKEELLKPVESTPKQDQKNKPTTLHSKIDHVDTPEQALEVVRNQPDSNTLIACLEKLSGENGFKQTFSLHTAGPLQAQLINALLTNVVPEYWQALEDKEKTLLVRCCTNLSGINALLGRLKLMSRQTPPPQEQIVDLINVLEHVFRTDDLITTLWKELNQVLQDGPKWHLAWKDTANLLGSGKVVAVVAQSQSRLEDANTLPSIWLAKGVKYASWLGRGTANLCIKTAPEDHSAALPQLVGKSLSLGYPAAYLKGLLSPLFREAVSTSSKSCISGLLRALPTHIKRQLLERTLRWLTEVTHAVSSSPTNDLSQGVQGRGASSIVSSLISVDQALQQHLLACLCDPGTLTSWSFSLRRACMASFATERPDELESLFEKLISVFGDPLFIRHATTLTQQSVAETLLITAGYLHRKAPMAVLMLARSSGHMQGVSNRLDSSAERPRWLGMIVGTVISYLVDKPEAQMSFGTDDMQTAEAKWFKELVKISDTVGSLREALTCFEEAPKPKRSRKQEAKTEQLPILNGKQVFGPPRPPQAVQTEIVGDRVTELSDDSTEEKEQEETRLKPYAKPDSDPEDSEEDPTLINRNKVRAPVYVRDLMSMLHDDKSHDRFQMGITKAASLIRRKANFGKEVKDHAEELLRILCNLQDPFSTPEFDELRLQAMIATLLSDIQLLAPWLARQTFSGEYSISQRCIMLTALGLSGRELAGLKAEDDAFNPPLTSTTSHFPSKQLPPRLHAIYTNTNPPPAQRLTPASNHLQKSLLQPLAIASAEKSTSHLNPLKVTKLSSRISASSRTTLTRKNALSPTLAKTFLLPLLSLSQTSPLLHQIPVLLTTYLRTLALLLHASGPATTDLPIATTEFWDLLLSLRTSAARDKTVLEAVLFSLLTILEVNTESGRGGQRRLAGENGKQMMETQEWVEIVFERVSHPGGNGGLVVVEEGREMGSGEEAKIRTLAAGVLVKMREVVEAYQNEVFGRVIE